MAEPVTDRLTEGPNIRYLALKATLSSRLSATEPVTDRLTEGPNIRYLALKATLSSRLSAK